MRRGASVGKAKILLYMAAKSQQSDKKSGLTANAWLTRSALGTRREILIATPT
ncbi:hypothetical protein [Sphaerospermopsis sp. LEGE 08334]|uniref:hypothetical protein n=1 Tax=Sphaerospermopsis sp. LEGE 08334 TaxID=1828651 RepID=UPI0018827BF5|nr:hypothetical protein [Sphaerospermopsis sp. LEGE 08334]MBE9054788.1 hypothetical protein [Sphaerospermopsis sp. LEGE 08334]